jgi:phosphinothricin acetyltransferase
MSGLHVRPGRLDDLPQLTDLYNHYVIHTPITFDIHPLTIDERRGWFDGHADTGRYRLLVAEDRRLLGYACTSRFRPKAAYETTVETSVYCRPDAVGRRIGTALYSALFTAIAGEDIHRIVAGITLPNPASVALHERFGFRQAGVFTANVRIFVDYWYVVLLV